MSGASYIQAFMSLAPLKRCWLGQLEYIDSGGVQVEGGWVRGGGGVLLGYPGGGSNTMPSLISVSLYHCWLLFSSNILYSLHFE